VVGTRNGIWVLHNGKLRDTVRLYSKFLEVAMGWVCSLEEGGRGDK
jgi:hypothetical protein